MIIEKVVQEENRRCDLCGSNEYRILHEGDESNCSCEGECLRVCDSASLSDEGCDGVAELFCQGNSEVLTYDLTGERLIDKAGNYGYRGWLSGEYICYTDGNYCDCGAAK